MPPTSPNTTPLHALRSRLVGLALRVDADEWLDVVALADDPAEVRALADLCGQVDEQITGKRADHPRYDAHVRRLLTLQDWHWHLADGGYSRITASLTEGPDQVLRFDVGLSTNRAFAAWDAANGGRHFRDSSPDPLTSSTR